MKMNLVLLCALLIGIRVGAMNDPIKAEKSNYVVIGAFSTMEHAALFTERAKKENLSAHYEINPYRLLFYVYVFNTGDKKLAVEEAKKVRKETSFWDTWVFTGQLGEKGYQPGSEGNDIHPDTGEKLNHITADDKPIVKLNEEQPAAAAHDETTSQVTEPATTTTTTPVVTPVSTTNDVDDNGRKFMFKIYRASNLKVMDGDVDVVDLENMKRKPSSYKGNQSVTVKSVNKSGDVSLECEVFGFRKIKQPIKFTAPEATEGITIEEGQAVVPFELVRLRKGDFAIMYNVFFFKDAAIMRPESRYEVNSLLDMMKENPNYRIRIHGHTNGGAAGKIIEVGETKNYFSLTGTKESFGTAKKLSEERAQVIRDFLISEGVDVSRLEVKAWGGKKPIYDKNDSQAQSNVRVEIEIISE